MRPLKQLSKVFVRYRSPGYYSVNFLQTIFKASVVEFVFSKIPCFHHIIMNTFRRMHLKYENYWKYLIIDIKTTFRPQ